MDDLTAQARGLGLPDESIAAMLGALDDDEPDTGFEVWPENWPTLLVFLALQTQWRREIPAMAGQIVWHGLPHSEIEPTIRLMGYQKRARKIFDGLKLMEAEALKHLNEAKA